MKPREEKKCKNIPTETVFNTLSPVCLALSEVRNLVAPTQTERHVADWIKAEVPHFKIGRRIYVRRDVLFWKTSGLDVKRLFARLEAKGLSDPMKTLAELDRLHLDGDREELQRKLAALDALEAGE